MHERVRRTRDKDRKTGCAVRKLAPPEEVYEVHFTRYVWMRVFASRLIHTVIRHRGVDLRNGTGTTQ